MDEAMIDRAIAEYVALVPQYEALLREIKFGLEKGLASRDLKVISIETRVKDVDSLRLKIKRRDYADPLSEIDDFAGARIVCLFSSDLDVVHEIVNDTFEVMETLDKTESLGLERMGYQGHHHVVRLFASNQGPRYDNLKELRAEIQVRTILQDAWARMSHKLIYKSEASMPAQVHRELNNVSSLLEIAQNIFDRSRDTREEYIERVQDRTKDPEEFLAQPIDRETLEAYTRWKYPSLPVDDYIQELLLRDIDQSSFQTLRDIDNAVTAASSAVEAYTRENPEWFKAGTDYITKSLGFFDANFRSKHPFAKRTLEAFNRHADKVGRRNVDG